MFGSKFAHAQRVILTVLMLAGRALAQEGSQGVIEQTGDLNVTTITQTGSANISSIALEGDRNGQSVGTLTQNGNGAFAEIFIEGDDNNFEVSQGTESDFYGVTIGNGNTYALTQINDYAGAYQNTGTILQSGDGNQAVLEQNVQAYGELGGVNQALITQSGIGNTATLKQTGTDNYAEISQTGNDNTGALIQNGVGLYAELSQIGNNLPGFTITQDCVTSSCDQGIIVNQTSIGTVIPPTAAGS